MRPFVTVALCVGICAVVAQAFFSIQIDKKQLRLPNIPIPMIALNVPSHQQIMSLLGKGGGGGGGGGHWSRPPPMMMMSSGWGKQNFNFLFKLVFVFYFVFYSI